jgi:hypothetical protein
MYIIMYPLLQTGTMAYNGQNLLHTKLGQYRGQLTGPRRPLTREPLDPRNSQRRPSDRRRFGPRMLTCESSRTRHTSDNFLILTFFKNYF